MMDAVIKEIGLEASDEEILNIVKEYLTKISLIKRSDMD